MGREIESGQGIGWYIVAKKSCKTGTSAILLNIVAVVLFRKRFQLRYSSKQHLEKRGALLPAVGVGHGARVPAGVLLTHPL
jgi:hypothetical protein